MTELILWGRLGTCSRRAIQKTAKRFGHPYHYRPRGDLLVRLSQETGMTIDQVHAQLLAERKLLLKIAGKT